jgi:hypothetical protein
MITREPLVGAPRSIQILNDGHGSLAYRLELRAEFWRRTQPKEKRATRERSFTELRFASFRLQFSRTARAVKGQDERPAGALDSPPRP